MNESRSTPRPGRYDPFRWLVWGLVILLGVTFVSTFVYMGLGRYYGRDDWTFINCLFMVVITLSTIGYGDVLNLKNAPLAEIFTMLLAIAGVGVPAFVISNVTGMIVDGMFGRTFRRRRMQKQISEMRGHIIVCGVGTTGYHIVEELSRTLRSFVAVDREHERLEVACEHLGAFPYIVGHADDDDVLTAAGIERAEGLIACLTDDKDNLYITLTARRLNPKLRIVSKVVDPRAAVKLLSAGANSTVNPTAIGGLRLVSELVRPTVVTFLDAMLRDSSESFRFEEVSVATGSAVEGQTLAMADLRKIADVLVLAARAPKGDKFHYNPKADFLLETGCTVVLLGRISDLKTVQTHFNSKKAT